MSYHNNVAPLKCSSCGNKIGYQAFSSHDKSKTLDHGNLPFALNLAQAAKLNNTYRTVIWTGEYLQVTLMCINVDDDIGLEVHPKANQFTYIVEGKGIIQMGNSKDDLNYEMQGYEGFAMIVPAGTWHNITNTGNTPLKLYTIYAPPLHPMGAIEHTKLSAESMEGS